MYKKEKLVYGDFQTMPPKDLAALRNRHGIHILQEGGSMVLVEGEADAIRSFIDCHPGWKTVRVLGSKNVPQKTRYPRT